MVKELEEFYRWLPAQGYRPMTVAVRRKQLRWLTAFLLARGVDAWSKVSFADLEAYTMHLFETPNRYGRVSGAGHRNNQIVAIKIFFPYLRAHGIIPSDPSAKLDFIRLARTLPRTIPSVAEMRRLLAVIDKGSVLGYRDRCILETMYAAGPRHAEILNLKISDLNLDEGVFQIIEGKGGKDRVVPLTAVAARLLRHYLKDVRPQLQRTNAASEYLFLSTNGKHLDAHFLGRMIETYLKKAGIKKHITPHGIRHACATHLLARNANMRHIQELLGHTSLQSTQIYTAVAITDLKRVIATCHPRNRDRFEALAV